MSPELAAFLSSWDFAPPIVVGIVVAGGLYAVGWTRLRRRGHGRLRLPVWRAVAFGFGLGAVGLALLSPLSAFSGLLFSLHMAQHLLLMIVASPLIWLGAPLLPFIWAFPAGWRKVIGRLIASGSPLHALFSFLTSAPVTLTTYLVVLAVWHVPAFYDAAQGRSVLHDGEHLMFFGAALLFWWPVIHPTGGRRRLSHAAAVLYIVPALVEGNLLGAVITFAPEPLYQTYRLAPRVFGLSALQDQQIGGLLMWVVGGLVLLIPIFILVYTLVSGEDEEDAERPEASVAERVK